MYEHSAITDQGKALLAACLAAEHAIEFTSYVLGAGTYTDAEKTTAGLKVKTALKDQRQIFSFTSATASGAEAILKVQVDNDGLDTGYYMREAGIYAKDATDNNATPILYQIGVDDTPSYMPDESTPLAIDTECHTVIDNESTVTFTFDHGAYAWADDLGDINQLTTTDKDNAVEAINEVKDEIRPISKGGTGKNNADDACDNLGAVRRSIYANVDDSSPLSADVYGGEYVISAGKMYLASQGKIDAGTVLNPYAGPGKNCDRVFADQELSQKASYNAITDNWEREFKCLMSASGYDIDDLVYILCARRVYKVTAAIAQNETMIVGTNIKEWSVEDETRELTSDLASLTTAVNSRAKIRTAYGPLASTTYVFYTGITDHAGIAIYYYTKPNSNREGPFFTNETNIGFPSGLPANTIFEMCSVYA